MTRITSFEVAGLAGRSKPYRVELSPTLNVFFGLNGSGKTTLLKLLYAAMRNDSSNLQSLPFSSATVTFRADQHAKTRSRTRTISKDAQPEAGSTELIEFADGSSEIVTVGTSPAIWESTPRDTRKYPAAYLSIARLLGGPHQNRYYYARQMGEEFDAESLLNETFVREVRTLWRQYTNRILLDVRQVQEQGLAEIMQSLFSDRPPTLHAHIDARSAYTRTNDFLTRQGASKIASRGTFQQRYDEDPRLRSVVENINGIEREIEVAEEPRHKLENLVRAFISGPKEIVFSDENISVQARGEVISLGSLSSGEKQLIRILVETISAGANVVIIDEPELSMHIDWQYQLLSALRVINPDCQLIVATHSPEVMAEVADAQIFRL